jgi:hypothetical protein
MPSGAWVYDYEQAMPVRLCTSVAGRIQYNTSATRSQLNEFACGE